MWISNVFSIGTVHASRFGKSCKIRVGQLLTLSRVILRANIEPNCALSSINSMVFTIVHIIRLLK